MGRKLRHQAALGVIEHHLIGCIHIQIAVARFQRHIHAAPHIAVARVPVFTGKVIHRCEAVGHQVVGAERPFNGAVYRIKPVTDIAHLRIEGVVAPVVIARIKRRKVALVAVVPVTRHILGGAVAEQKEGVPHQSGSVRLRVVPCHIHMVVGAVDLDLVPLVEHRVGFHDLAVHADLREQIGIALGIAVAFAVIVHHKIIDLARDQVAAVECQLVVEDQRLLKIGHAVVHLVEVPLRFAAELTAHLAHLLVGIKLLRLSARRVEHRRAVVVVTHFAPMHLERIDHFGAAVARGNGHGITRGHIEQLRMRAHDGLKERIDVRIGQLAVVELDLCLQVVNSPRGPVYRFLMIFIKILVTRNVPKGHIILERRRLAWDHRGGHYHDQHQNSGQKFFHTYPSVCGFFHYNIPDASPQLTNLPFFARNNCAGYPNAYAAPGAHIMGQTKTGRQLT